MKYLISILLLTMVIGHTLMAQKMTFPDLKNRNYKANEGSDLQSTPCKGTINPHLINEDWNITLKNYGAYHHTSSIPTKQLEILKKTANDVRVAKITPEKIEHTPSGRVETTPPFLGRNFRGNLRGNNVPMDNSMAISRNGFIVSAINSNVLFSNPEGKVTYNKGFADFFTLLGLGTRMYDPRVIYDVEANRFVFMCLHGSEPANTFLCLAFSKTEDPNGEWNYYKIDGNPSGDDRWFDYPNIALSKSDFYIAGLMRDLPGDWQYSVMYQIDKNDGYEGNPLTWKYYNDLKDADNLPSFNLVPALSGWNTLLTPGMYFVSNNATGGNTYNLYYTTESVKNNPSLISLQTLGTTTQLAPDARQPNTANVLNTFDSRIWSAMYLNGTIHMGSHVNTPAGDVGLFYGRMKVSDLDLQTDVLTFSGQDFGFPSFAAFGNQADSEEILVNYLISGPSIFPGQQQRVCSGNGASFLWSEPVDLKAGASFINVLSDNFERWGDYTTAGRRFVNNRTEAWVTGCFGETGGYSTWLGQLLDANQEKSMPMAEFTADLTTTQKDTTIRFNDLTAHNPTSWSWTFEGGVPATSTEKAPSVRYNAYGSFDVKLVVTNDLGTDTLVKPDFIHIQEAVTKPKANFYIINDTIFTGDFVNFVNQSSENSITYKWTFTGGIPGTSNEKEPVIQYKSAGTFLVALTVANIAGTSTKILQKAVVVQKRAIPNVQISADKTIIMPGDSIHFFDKTQGGPSQWKWFFSGGEPAESTAQNPVVKYPNEGKFDVTLVASNEEGIDSVTKLSYVHVGQSSIEENPILTDLQLYPNPVTDNQVNLVFQQATKEDIQIYLLNNQGNVIKYIYDDVVKAGKNVLTFNTTHLSDGLYFVAFSKGSKILKTVTFTVIH